MRAIRAVKILARDGRIPRPLRGLVVVGLLPLPGPVDEALLLLAAGLLFAFYREPMREAWRRSAPGRVSPRAYEGDALHRPPEQHLPAELPHQGERSFALAKIKPL